MWKARQFEARIKDGVRFRQGEADVPGCAAVDLERAGDKQQAILELEQEVKRNPQKADSILMLGRLYRETGDHAKAAEVIRRFSRNAADRDERCRLLRSDPEFEHALTPDERESLGRTCPPK